MTNKPHTMLDVWGAVALNKNLCPTIVKAFTENQFNARKFVFTDEVAIAMAGLMKDHPMTLLDNMQFGLPPYPVTYIEFPVGLFLDTLGQRRSHEKWQEEGLFSAENIDQTKDITVGYLIVGNMVYSLSKLNSGDIALNPVCYKMQFDAADQRMVFKGLVPLTWRDVDSEDRPAGIDEYNELAQALGSTLTNRKTELTIEQANFLLQSHTACDAVGLDFLKTPILGMDTSTRFRSLLEGSMGEIRNILLCLLWINQPKLVEIETFPATRGWFKGKNRAYSSYSLVSLRKEITVRRALGVFREHSKHRRHEVQSYFRNFDKHEGCAHEWPLYPDAEGRWTCPRCGQWRIRVKEHVRGDATLGWVNKDYIVK